MTVNPIDDNTAAWAAWFNGMMNAHAGEGIISGCSISKGTGDWDIDVTSGSIFESSTEASISSGTVTITDSSGLTSGQSRVTIITADTGDALASTDGSAAADPATPDIPAGEVLLGFVVVDEGDSTAADSDIFDIPALSHAQHDAADFDGADGTNGQVLKSDGSESSWNDLVGTSSDPGLAFDTWRQADADQVVFLFVSVKVVEQGNFAGRIDLDVDESGGTTSDYSLNASGVHDSTGAVTMRTALTTMLPAGAQYKITNVSDPASSNAIENHREFTI